VIPTSGQRWAILALVFSAACGSLPKLNELTPFLSCDEGLLSPSGHGDPFPPEAGLRQNPLTDKGG